MSKIKKKRKEIVKYGININEKIERIKIILNSCEQIFTTLLPILNKFLLTEEAKLYRKNGTFDKLKQLLTVLAEESKKIEDSSFSSEFFNTLNDLKN